MKRSEAYLQAAELFATRKNLNYGCCDVIAKVIQNHDRAYIMRELLIFRPDVFEDGDWWWPYYDSNIRVLALCFMAAIAQDAGQ